jgi:hypothetical protein
MATRLMECATSLNMERVALPLGWVTHLPYNMVLHGLILNLVFLLIYLGYTDNLTIGDKGEPDHFLLLLDVPLKVFWPAGKMSIKANSEEEADFLGEVIISLGQIPIPDVISVDQTQAVAQVISKVFDLAWTHHAKAKWACTYSKPWWDPDCAQAKASAMTSDLLANWMAFKKATHKAKHIHFDELTRLLTLICDAGTLWTGSVPAKHPLLRLFHTRVCLAHHWINCGMHSTPLSTQLWTACRPVCAGQQMGILLHQGLGTISCC